MMWLWIVAACSSNPEDTSIDVGTEVDSDVDTDSALQDDLPEHVVTADTPRDWQWLAVNTATASFTSDPAWPEDGDGAFLLTTGDGEGQTGGAWPAWEDGGGKAFLGTTRLNDVVVTDVSALAFQTWSVQDSALLPYINVFVDIDRDGVFSPATDDIWAFDPAYVTSPAITGSWQSWDALTAPHWRCILGNSPMDEGMCGLAVDMTWTELTDGSPSAVLIGAPCGEAPFPDADCTDPSEDGPAILFVGGQKTGGPWADWQAAIDAIEVEPGGPGRPMDFEP